KLRDWANRIKNDFTNINTVTTKGGSEGFAPRLSFAEVKNLNVGAHEDRKNSAESDTFSIKATITAISHNQEKPPWYTAAPDASVKAKVINDGKGSYFCAVNNKTYSTYELKYVLRFCATDWSGQQWLNAFDKRAQDILTVPVEELDKTIKDGDLDKFEEVFQRANFKTKIFKVRAKLSNFQDERRVHYDAVGIQDVDLKAECQLLLDKISELDQIQSIH
ncbi:hypothetical protein RFI_04653, partial [Reticulomyxa filosa]